MGGELSFERLFRRVIDAHDHPLQRLFRDADGAHGVVDAAWSKAALNDFETTAFAEDHVSGWDADVSEGDVAVAVGGVVVAHY